MTLSNSECVTPDHGLFGFVPATACPGRIQICVEGGDVGQILRDKIQGVETGRSERTTTEAQAGPKGPQGVSIPVLTEATRPHRGDCLEGEPEIFEKSINDDPRNIECSATSAGGPSTTPIHSCDITVALPSEGPEELSGKPESSSQKP
jgi:hypothetical protein